MRRVFCTIAHHGYGHLAQTAVVLNALGRACPDIELTIATALKAEMLARRIELPYTQLAEETEPGLAMHHALSIDFDTSYRHYTDYHRNWAHRVAQAADLLRENRAQLVISNVSYLFLQAAREAGIPAIGMCSLNWYDIFQHYFSDRPGSDTISRQMLSAYRAADVFLKLEPGMPMNALDNARPTGCIAGRGQNRRGEILQRLGAEHSARLVLIALGGIPTPLDLGTWPAEGYCYLTEPAAARSHPKAASWSDLAFPYLDLIASADVIISKPGYGTFTEAAVHGRPLIYLARGDWPESPYLQQWAQAFIPTVEVSDFAELNRDIARLLPSLSGAAAAPGPGTSGVQECVELIRSCLDQAGSQS